MWSYYGRKSKIVSCYPNPKFDTIIEPFAGTAVFSLYKDNWKKNVILVEKDPLLTQLWSYLQKVSKEEIIGLPDIKQGDDIRSLPICQEQRWLMGFWINRGSESPKNIVTKWGGKSDYWTKTKQRIADNLYKIKHWRIVNDSYENAPNLCATWFVDPPYQFGRDRYKYSNKSIDFSALAEWCKTRKGQTIVCENSKANWLPFTPITNLCGQKHTTTECMWYSEN